MRKAARNNTRPRVTVATRIFWPEPGAASARLEGLVKELVQRRASVRVLTTTPPKSARWTKAVFHGCQTSPRVLRWPALRDRSGYIRGYLHYLSFDVPLFFRLLLGPKPDVVLVEPPPTTGAVARAACALRRVPYVWYAADVWSAALASAGGNAFVVRALRALERFAVGGATCVIAVSPGVASRVENLGASSVHVVPNGIDTDMYSSETAPLTEGELRDLGIAAPYFLYAGTASEWQGASIFAAAAKDPVLLEQDFQLVFLGQGTQWSEIAEIGAEVAAQRGNDTVLQLTQRSPREVAQLLAGAEAALVSLAPENGYSFAYPTKVLAALSVGTPVLYAGEGSAGHDVERLGAGVCVPYQARAVARAIEGFLQEQPAKVSRGRGRKWVETERSSAVSAGRVADLLLGGRLTADR